MTEKEFFYLTLHELMNYERTLYSTIQGVTLILKPDSELSQLQPRVFTNYVNLNQEFSRDTFNEIVPSVDFLDVEFKLEDLNRAGSFKFLITKGGNSLNLEDPNSICGKGYFSVQPRLLTEKGHEINLDAVVMQTYITKCLGPLGEWQERLLAAVKTNYNMIHLTPIQELGYSKSAYSLKNQLSIDPAYTRGCSSDGWQEIKGVVNSLNTNHGILTISDLVLNHTASNSDWIREHPECGFNLSNSPYLVGAYVLDRILWNVTIDISNKQLDHIGLSPERCSDPEFWPKLRNHVWARVNEAKIFEFYLLDCKDVLRRFTQWLNDPSAEMETIPCAQCLHDALCSHHEYHEKDEIPFSINYGGLRSRQRFGGTINFRHALRFLFDSRDRRFVANSTRVDEAIARLGNIIDKLNWEKTNDVKHHLDVAVGNFMANYSYRFLDQNGPRIKKVSPDTPLMWNYFYQQDIGLAKDMTKIEEECATYALARKIMVYNGWVMSDDPLRNFAEEPSNVYLRRELIVWGDSVKLRYGTSPATCPHLWDHMKKYSEMTADLFHGIRLDNCHSTPIHVSQFMLDAARRIRPDIYIIAELFTGDESLDNLFVNEIGISSLIREALQANTCCELGRQSHKYGATQPAGSLASYTDKELKPRISHSLFYDMTHDNKSPAMLRSLHDYLPTAAILSAASCGMASTRGYDEMVPEQIDVVTEERMYSRLNGSELDLDHGIMKGKGLLNALHRQLDEEGFSETFVDQVSESVLAISRFCPSTGDSVVTIAHSAFNDPGNKPQHSFIRDISLNGVIERVLLDARLLIKADGWNYDLVQQFEKNANFINGFGAEIIGLDMKVNTGTEKSDTFRVIKETFEYGEKDRVTFTNFPPGSVLILRVKLVQTQAEALSAYRQNLRDQFNLNSTSETDLKCDLILQKDELMGTIEKLSYEELNILLYRCEQEERANGNPWGLYNVPNYGPFTFAGLQGQISAMEPIALMNNLEHPICENIRQGNWLIDYITKRIDQSLEHVLRLEHVQNLIEFSEKMKVVLKSVSLLPGYLRPSKLYTVLELCHLIITKSILLRMPSWISAGCGMVKRFSLASLPFQGYIANCKYPPNDAKVSMAAGLPHFAEGFWRSWGRDTFISLRGILILTGRSNEALELILRFGSVIRNGLVPNLIGDGASVRPRYNCRDATWFWLNSINDFDRTFPEVKVYEATLIHENEEKTLLSLIKDVLQKHLDGIEFLEENAGPQIDEQMQFEGFKIKAGVESGTGFVFGGNRYNCGTWMDKMGSSEKARNRGWPATPRDGSAIELVGLSYAVCKYLAKKDLSLKFNFNGNNEFTLEKWADLIKDNFEKEFYMPDQGTYRDTVRSHSEANDRKLRPNLLVAMVVASDLFNLENAIGCLKNVDKELIGHVGMKTLSWKDEQYRGFYNNDDDSYDGSIAKGFNYHNGPEWLWLTGYYIRAKLIFAERYSKIQSNENPLKTALKEARVILGRMDKMMSTSPWKSLPELTNKDGQFCQHSCPAQAWSVACAIEAIYDMNTILMK